MFQTLSEVGRHGIAAPRLGDDDDAVAPVLPNGEADFVSEQALGLGFLSSGDAFLLCGGCNGGVS